MLDTEGQALKDILLTEGICTSEQVQDAEDEHERTGTSFWKVIVNYGFLTELEILNILRRILEQKYIISKKEIYHTA